MSDPSTRFLASLIMGATTARDMDLWVDASVGSDANDGGASSPLRTLTAAVEKIPLRVRHLVTVHVNPGTYAERLDLQFFMTDQGGVTFAGEQWRAYLPSQGIRAGALDGAFGVRPIPNTATCAAGGWAADELKGRFVHITSGPAAGAYLPVASNTATTLDFGMPADRTAGRGRDLRGQNFELVEPTAILSQQGASSHLVMVTGTMPVGGTRNINLPPPWRLPAVQFRNFRFDSGTAPFALSCGPGVSLNLASCKLDLGLRSSYGLVGSREARLTATDCYWAMRFAGITTFGVLCSGGSTLGLNNCIMDNGWRAVTLSNAHGLLSGVYQNQQNLGIELWESKAHCSDSNIVLRGQRSAINLYDASALWLRPAAGCGFITNTTGEAIRIARFDVGAGSGNIVTLRRLVIDGCGTGLAIEGPDNVVDVGASTIRNSAGWGINAGASRHACLNAVSVDPATAMNGNQSGDFSLDGATATSLAALRAAPGREILAPGRLSRLFES